MNEVYTNRLNLIKIIESCQKNSFYSSLPSPTLIAVSKQQPDNKDICRQVSQFHENVWWLLTPPFIKVP